MTTRLSNHIRGILKTFGLLPGAMRGLPFDRKVEVLLEGRSDVAPIVRPMLVAWRHLRVQVAVFDKAIRAMARTSAAARLLMSVPGIGVLSAIAYVSTVEDPSRFFSITICRRPSRAYATSIPIGRSRSKRPNIEVWRHPYSNADVRGCWRNPVEGEKDIKFAGLGRRDRQAIGTWQGQSGAGQKALGDPA
jgi:hypothetical protein